MIHEELELILEDASEHMAKSIDHLRQELMSIRAGRATPSMLENVKVDYYGSITPLSQMASINAPQADLLVVQPWDASALADIEKAIQSANLGLNPSNDGAMIRLPVPPLSEDRRLPARGVRMPRSPFEMCVDMQKTMSSLHRMKKIFLKTCDLKRKTLFRQ